MTTAVSWLKNVLSLKIVKSWLLFRLLAICLIQIIILSVVLVQAQDTETPSEEDETTIDPNVLYTGNISLCKNVSNRVFLPYVGDCSKYYLCWDGEAVVKECKKDYQFNARNQSCVHPTNETCLPTCEPYILSTFSYDRTCSKYVLCYYGVPVLRQCHDDLQYNAETDRCDFPQYVDCVDNKCMRMNETTDMLYLPSKASCTKYFLCAKGVPIKSECAEGLHFSSGCNCCDYPNRSQCQIPAIKRNIQPYSRMPARSADIECPSRGVHFQAHKSRPDAYYYCVNGLGITLDCTPGLWYDQNVQECREPKHIGF